jgi:membrane-associated phospholipid phosphatase
MALWRIPTRRLRFACGAGVVIPLYAIYQLANRVHVFEPRFLPQTSIDQAVPFLPWTAVPYIMMTSLVFLWIFVRDPRHFWRSLLACVIGFGINILIWSFYPTVIARPPLPAPSLASLAYRTMVLTDTPANCLPSGHITMPLLACYAFVRERPRAGWVIWPIFLLFSVTLLTTKQHYLIDVPAGALTATIGLVLASWLLPDERFPAAGQGASARTPDGAYARPPAPGLRGS